MILQFVLFNKHLIILIIEAIHDGVIVQFLQPLAQLQLELAHIVVTALEHVLHLPIRVGLELAEQLLHLKLHDDAAEEALLATPIHELVCVVRVAQQCNHFVEVVLLSRRLRRTHIHCTCVPGVLTLSASLRDIDQVLTLRCVPLCHVHR